MPFLQVSPKERELQRVFLNFEQYNVIQHVEKLGETIRIGISEVFMQNRKNSFSECAAPNLWEPGLVEQSQHS